MRGRATPSVALLVIAAAFLLHPRPALPAEKPDLASLKAGLESTDAGKRAEAARAVAEARAKEALPTLLEAAARERDRTAALAMIRALAALGDKRGLSGLLDVLGRWDDPDVVGAACLALHAIDGKVAFKMIRRALGQERSGIARARLVAALGRFPSAEASKVLRRVALTDTFLLVRLRAVEMLRGRVSGPELVKAVKGGLTRGKPEHRAHAAWMAGRLALEETAPSLRKVATNPKHPAFLDGVLALGRMPSPENVRYLVAVWGRPLPDEDLRPALAHSLGAVKDRRAIGPLLAGLASGDWLLRAVCAQALSEIESDRVPQALLDAARSTPNPETLRALGLVGDPRAFGLLAGAQDRFAGRERREALAALARLNHPGRVKTLRFAADGKTAEERAHVARLIGRHGLRPLAGVLERMLGFETLDDRMAAAKALGMIGDKNSLALLAKFAGKKEGHPSFRALCLQSLGKVLDANPDLLDGASGGAAVAAMIRCLDLSDPVVRAAAAWALEACPVPEAVDALLAAAGKAKDGYFRRTLFLALRKVTGTALADETEAWKAWWKGARAGFREAARARDKEVSVPAFATYLDDLRQRGLDLVFVFDVTGSMGGELTLAQEKMEEIAGLLSRLVPSLRVGFVAYEDRVTLNQPLTHDMAAVVKRIKPLAAFGGGDWEEGVCPGLEAAFETQPWRAAARKVVVLIGDAAPHRPRRAALSAALAHERLGIDVCAIAAHTSDLGKLPSFSEIGLRGGGDVAVLRDRSRLLDYFVIYALGPRWKHETEAVLRSLE